MGVWNNIVLKKSYYSCFDFHCRVLQVSVVWRAEQLWQGVGPRELQRWASVPSCFNPLLHSSPSIACTPKDTHGTLTECLGSSVTFFFLVLRGNLLSCGLLSSIWSWMTQSLRAVELRSPPSLSQLPFLGSLVCPSVFLQQDLFLYWILHRKVRMALQQGVIGQQGSQWPSIGSTGRRDQQSCTRGSLVVPAAEQMPCVRGVSLSHLRRFKSVLQNFKPNTIQAQIYVWLEFW